MIRLPVLKHLTISDYGLFPGQPEGSGLDHEFQSGLTLIAGINGLGKTTILTSILRALTGPVDVTGEGAPHALGVSVPENPVALRPKQIAFFAQRVADGAQAALVVLSATFGDQSLRVTRRLADLSLVECVIDGVALPLAGARAEREASFQTALTELMGLGSFIDVLLIMHHVLLFHEDRPGALWDQNAQRQVLRALFLEKDDATRVAQLERLVQSADSQARNIQTRITATERDLREARKREAGSEGVIAQLEAEQKLLDAELVEAARLDSVLADLETERQTVRLEHEKAKHEREEATGAVERLKYTALLNLYPTMDDAARLVVARIMTQAKCLVCDADAEEKRKELEALVEGGCCPACGAEPEKQERIIPQHKFEQAKLDQARRQAELARKEEEAKAARLRVIADTYVQTIAKVGDLRRSIADRKARDQRLRASLPRSTTSDQFEKALVTLRGQQLEWRTKLGEHLLELRTLLSEKEELVTSRSAELMESFVELTNALLAEKACLVQVTAEPRYTQAGRAEDRLRVPAFQADMAAANRPGLVRRIDPSDVSESQRELIDLAFRLSLVRVATQGAPSTFIMETPEASLDGLAMERVGAALAKFAQSSDNRLIVTSNLSNAGLITSLFNGPAKDDAEVVARRGRLINLLQLAAPNRALDRDRAKYEQLLDHALTGDQP
ncbi:hypothetical protein Q9K01_11945 [Qipengyuania sp. DY56-A-20]|jgi:hypothetical protein|uniref:Rad50/SbcC-type AAA domain-containing protein n=1 Tax=Qipengyuania benthica TaxID=3067651 RepID=A0ABT9HBV7_9SPHN|nr:AAA family ATPase [Qipengyuania sp. DY56-A-20]MDP4540340.1 hypothetical protein [Qipengyuania sp. DY56-A-20]